MRFYFSFIAAFLILFTSIIAQVPSNTPQNSDEIIAEARRRVVGPPKITKLDSSVVTVPMVGSKTLPLVEVKINGKGPYKLLLDTGADVTLLQMRVADELNLPVLRTGQTSKILAVSSLQIGGARFEDVVVGAKTWNEKIDGVIGFNLFADCLLTMDFSRQRISVRKGVLPTANGKDVLTYGLDNRSPTLDINLDSQRITFLIDTGAAQTLVIPEAIAGKLTFPDGLGSGPELSTFQTPKSRARTGRLSGSISLGMHIIAKPLIYVWTDEVPVIGSALLQDFVLTFDQKNRTVKIGV